jgi:MOSC domain-containing protein YiiM
MSTALITAPITAPATIISVQTGAIAPLGPKATPSAFVKHPRTDVVPVGFLGLEGDEQADPRYHGGPDKAVYAYAAAHYPLWMAERPQDAAMLRPGAFGENLTIDGLVEADICIGDVHAIGDVRLQVCQPRRPCFKLDLHFNDKVMVKAMVQTRRSGWYYRVLTPGTVQVGNTVSLVNRPHPDFTLSRLIEIGYGHNDGMADWATLATLDGAATNWREIAVKKGKRPAP